MCAVRPEDITVFAYENLPFETTGPWSNSFNGKEAFYNDLSERELLADDDGKFKKHGVRIALRLHRITTLVIRDDCGADTCEIEVDLESCPMTIQVMVCEHEVAIQAIEKLRFTLREAKKHHKTASLGYAFRVSKCAKEEIG